MKTTISQDGTTLAYDVYGSGPALIYITGASCFRNFIPVTNDAKVFAKEFTVYNYDRRGRGDSGNTLPYAIAREVEDIEAMIDAAGGSAYLYGHSSGAVLALEAAMLLGDKVKKVTLYDASYVHNAAEKAEYAQLSREVQKLLASGKNTEAMKGFLRSIGMPKILVSLLPLFPGWRTMRKLAPTLMHDIALTENVPPLERTAKIMTPTFVMVGQKNPVGLHQVAQQLAQTIPNAKFQEIIGLGHMVSAKTLLPELVGFLKQDENQVAG